LKFSSKSFETGQDTEGLLSLAHSRQTGTQDSTEGSVTACSYGDGMKIKVVWFFPQGHQHEGPSDVHISRGVDFFEVLPPSSVQQTGRSDRTSFVGSPLRNVKVHIDKLSIDSQQKEVMTEICVGAFESQLSQTLACGIAETVREELEAKSAKINDLFQKLPSSLISINKHTENTSHKKPSPKWTHEWFFVDQDEKITRSQEKFEQIFVNTSRRH